MNEHGTRPATRDPRIVTQPDNWSCYACVAAMITGKQLQDVIDFVGHDGSRRSDDSKHPDKRVGFTHGEVSAYLAHHGLALNCWLTLDNGELRIPAEFNNMERMQAELVVESERLKGVAHSVWWTGYEVLDPNFCDPQPLNKYKVICVNPLVRI